MYLGQVRNTHNMPSFQDFPRWYNNKDVAPILEAMKKNGSILSQQRYWFVETELYPNNAGEQLPPYLHDCQVLPIPRRR